MSDYKLGLLPFDPEKHARFTSAQDVGFTFTTPIYPIDKTGGLQDWGMGGNGPDPTLTANGGQPCGDCGVCMCPMHANMMAAIIIGESPSAAQMTSDQVVDLYLTYTGGQDTGVDLGDWLLWLTTHDQDGHPAAVGQGVVEAFVRVDLADLDAALAQFDLVGVGVSLNPQADTQFPDGWDVGPGDEPDPQRGHAILYAAAESASGPFKWISWGAAATSTLAWKEQCPDQAFAILTRVEAEAKGFVQQFDAISADIHAMGGTVVPVPPIAPTPIPTPSPVVPTPNTPPPSPATPPDVTPELLAWLRGVLDWLESLT